MHAYTTRPGPRPEPGEGCLTKAIRLPVQILAVIVVLPLRLLWDALTACCRALYRWVLAPVGRALGWLLKVFVLIPLRAVATALAWLLHTLVVAPLAWLYRVLLTPLGRGLRRLLHYLLVVPLVALYRWVLTPVGHAVSWMARGLWALLTLVVRYTLVLPLLALWRYVLGPVLRGIGAVFAWAWHVAGHISRSLWSCVSTVFRLLVVVPVGWVWRTLLRPVLTGIRDGLWRPVSRAVRQALREVRRALLGAPRR
ncbi:hypothetical protein [Streptomyces palmae]|uniref:hypothetical protein n=1 Tax=Streptomyces palmae TaxID=1701085 RepID=UPI001FD7EE58|nr:hypothetical protein [Streptomyces palmae]